MYVIYLRLDKFAFPAFNDDEQFWTKKWQACLNRAAIPGRHLGEGGGQIPLPDFLECPQHMLQTIIVLYI